MLFSKFIEAIPVPDAMAETSAKALINTIIVRYGSPRQNITDRGVGYESALFKELSPFGYT